MFKKTRRLSMKNTTVRLFRQELDLIPKHEFSFKWKLYSLEAMLIELFVRAFPWVTYLQTKWSHQSWHAVRSWWLSPSFPGFHSWRCSWIRLRKESGFNPATWWLFAIAGMSIMQCSISGNWAVSILSFLWKAMQLAQFRSTNWNNSW